MLTAGRLAAHNDAAEGDDGMAVETAHSIDAAAPVQQSDCFAPIRQKWNSQLESDREACAVLAAIDEVLKEQGDGSNVTAYWGALMTSLKSAAESQTETSVAAICYLLSLVFPRVPAAVRVKHFTETGALLSGVRHPLRTVSRPFAEAPTCPCVRGGAAR